MKKIFTSIAVVAAALTSFSAIAGNGKTLSYEAPTLSPTSIKSMQAVTGDKGITEGGFFLHYTPFAPSKRYMFPKSAEVTYVDGTTETFGQDELDTLQNAGKFGFGHGIEIGNMFRLSDFEPMAISLRVTWLNIKGAGFKHKSGFTGGGAVVSLQALKIGPSFTYALSDKMAVDAYYQVAPTLTLGLVVTEHVASGEDYSFPIVSSGFLHEIGVNYRFDILSVGLGYSLGNTSLKGNINGDEFKIKSGGSALLINLGMKF